ncbi:MAG: hypothetical protein ACLP3B_10965 [Syntrophobacteraceae bacterium]
MEQLVTPHPLQETIREKSLKLWQLRILLKGSPSEGHLSRVLRGIQPMPGKLEERIRTILKEV